MQDSYMSVVKALEHASMRCGRKLKLQVCRISLAFQRILLTS
jgi:CTP synthase (UTP-ammonia lyase)